MKRSRPKSDDRSLRALSRLLVKGAQVVVVSGAGLSVASGIPTFRGTDNSVWAQSLTEWGTREKFEEDPLVWYNTFWARHHLPFYPQYRESVPNAGHDAIASMAMMFPKNLNIVTQNVDTLHIKSGVPGNNLVEVHGRLGLHKCITPGCPFTLEKSHYNIKYDASLEDGQYRVNSVPACSSCGKPLMPQALMFDEMYESHTHYQWQKVLGWFQRAEAFVFVGTSFAVNVTSEALSQAAHRRTPVFNFNVVREKGLAQPQLELHQILGKCEVTLPKLLSLCCSTDQIDDDKEELVHSAARVRRRVRPKVEAAGAAAGGGGGGAAAAVNGLCIQPEKWVACDRCSKWWIVEGNLGSYEAGDWVCAMHPQGNGGCEGSGAMGGGSGGAGTPTAAETAGGDEKTDEKTEQLL
jgi:NAD-dependent SIR2 family protein deacetylase